MILMDSSWLCPCFARHYLQFKPRYSLRDVVSHDLSIKIYQNLTTICSFKCLIHNIKNLWNSLEKVLTKRIQRKMMEIVSWFQVNQMANDQKYHKIDLYNFLKQSLFQKKTSKSQQYKNILPLVLLCLILILNSKC